MILGDASKRFTAQVEVHNMFAGLSNDEEASCGMHSESGQHLPAGFIEVYMCQ